MIPGNFMDDNSYMDPRNWKIIPNIMLDATDIIYYGEQAITYGILVKVCGWPFLFG